MAQQEEETQRGLLISFEGSEGSGKTTQIARLTEHLENLGHDVIVTREPGGTAIGEEVRHLLKHGISSDAMFPETELLLFAASRAQLVREVILPGLESGKIILCDRYLDSTTVYQGVARQIATDPVTFINDFAVGNLMPDLTIVLDIPAEIGMNRIKHRATGIPDRMEKENIEFYQAVREGYLLLVSSLPQRFSVFDGTKPKDQLEKEIWEEISRRFFDED
ncbi:MAG: dTMP kinase [Opitutales bacterium]|nr:dTMP kinase [Opitutales bacterium]